MNKMTNIGRNTQKKVKKLFEKCIFFHWKGFDICFVFTGENAFKHFLFINTVLQRSVFL